MLEHNTTERIDMLKGRTKRCVCKYCGSNLRLRRIIFSTYEDTRVEIFCENCNRIEFGVEPEVYVSAEIFCRRKWFQLF